jgi:hypothetical protein
VLRSGHHYTPRITTKEEIPVANILGELRVAIRTHEISKATIDKLNEYSAALCESNAYGEFADREYPQVCETVRSHLLRSHIEKLQNHVVELHDHITSLNRKNEITQYCVIALTIAALIGTGAQVWYAKKADKRSLLTQQQTISTQTAKPTEQKNGTEANSLKSQPVPQIHQTTPKKDATRQPHFLSTEGS